MHDKTVSIAKGIGITLMVVGHSGCPDLLARFIGLFHMPLFFFLSGYLFNNKYISDKRLFVKRKLKGLYWPFVKWQLLFLALHGVFYRLHFYSSDYSAAEYPEKIVRILALSGGEQLLGGYWFLIELLFSSIIALLIIYTLDVIAHRRPTTGKQVAYAQISGGVKRCV